MSKSITAAIPFAAASATIRVTHGAGKALPMRHKTASMLRNQQKQSNLQRHRKMLRTPHISVTRRPPGARKIHTSAAERNIVQVNRACNPRPSCLPGKVALRSSHLQESRKRARPFPALPVYLQTRISSYTTGKVLFFSTREEKF